MCASAVKRDGVDDLLGVSCLDAISARGGALPLAVLGDRKHVRRTCASCLAPAEMYDSKWALTVVSSRGASRAQVLPLAKQDHEYRCDRPSSNTSMCPTPRVVKR